MNNKNNNGVIFDSIPYPTLPIKKSLLLKNKQFPKEYNLLKKYKGDMYPVFRQYVCGSCWAWSVASLLSDRYMIKYKSKNPMFSPTSIISGIYCKMKRSPDIDLYNACEGGSAFDALVLISEIMNSKDKIECDPFVSQSRDDLRYLLKPLQCDNYDWCELNPNCNTSIASSTNEVMDHLKKDKNLNKIVPEYTIDCQEHKPNEDYSVTVSTRYSNNKKKYRLRLSKAYTLEDIDHIKYSIFTKGPVINNFVIFPDFINKPSQKIKHWEETDNVYIHKKGVNIYDLGDGNGSDNDMLLGYHSTTVVGWGVQKFNKRRLYNILKVPDTFLNKRLDEGENGDDEVEIEYWICRNIWGKNWNGDGYFKLAVTNKELDINTEIGADVPVKLKINNCYMPCGTHCDRGDTCMKSQFGGCCAIDILDDNEMDVTDADIVRNALTNNKIYRNFITINNIPSSYSDLNNIVILDLDHKRFLDKNKKTVIKIVLLMILIYLLFRMNFLRRPWDSLMIPGNCKNIVFLVLVLVALIISTKL